MSPGIGSQAYPKSAQVGTSRVQRKQQKRAEEAAAIKACYAAVNERDGRVCRVCGKRTAANGGLLHRTVHHHLIYRSKISVQGGRHETWNVLTICPDCDSQMHVEGVLRLEGDADARDKVTGKLCGVAVSRYDEQRGWRIEKWC